MTKAADLSKTGSLVNSSGQIDLTTGVTSTLPISNGGTGTTTQAGAANAILPSQTGNSGKYLTTNGTDASWGTIASSQWTTSGSNIYYNTGNVGIGTNSPSMGFHVVKNWTSGAATVGAQSVTAFASGGEAGYGTFDSNGNRDAYFSSANTETRVWVSVNKPLVFGTNSTERMRVTAAGGISFGSSGTAYGSSGQLLQSNGDAAPTWVTAALLGSGQSWTDVGGSRSSGTTYTNSTGKPIQIMVCTDNTGNTTYNSGGAAKFYINGSNVGQQFCSNAANIGGLFQAVIPNGSTYSVSASTIRSWWELR